MPPLTLAVPPAPDHPLHLKADARHGASSNASSNADVLTRTAADQLNDECLLTPKSRTDSDGFNDG
jgi:hypothetical protein